MNVEEVAGFPVEKYLHTLALVLLVSKLFGESAELVKQLPVLGELIVGIMLGASVLAIVPPLHGLGRYAALRLLPWLDRNCDTSFFGVRLYTNLRESTSVRILSTVVEEVT